MNTRKVKAKFKNFRTLLNSGCISIVVMGRLVEKLHPDKDDLMQCHTQVGNITTYIKAKVDFTLPKLSTMNVVTWKFHMGDSAKVMYDMI